MGGAVLADAGELGTPQARQELLELGVGEVTARLHRVTGGPAIWLVDGGAHPVREPRRRFPHRRGERRHLVIAGPVGGNADQDRRHRAHPVGAHRAGDLHHVAVGGDGSPVLAYPVERVVSGTVGGKAGGEHGAVRGVEAPLLSVPVGDPHHLGTGDMRHDHRAARIWPGQRQRLLGRVRSRLEVERIDQLPQCPRSVGEQSPHGGAEAVTTPLTVLVDVTACPQRVDEGVQGAAGDSQLLCQLAHREPVLGSRQGFHQVQRPFDRRHLSRVFELMLHDRRPA